MFASEIARCEAELAKMRPPRCRDPRSSFIGGPQPEQPPADREGRRKFGEQLERRGFVDSPRPQEQRDRETERRREGRSKWEDYAWDELQAMSRDDRPRFEKLLNEKREREGRHDQIVGGKPEKPAAKQVHQGPTWEGKVYRDLSYTQRAQLKNEDPSLFIKMKSAWVAAGMPDRA